MSASSLLLFRRGAPDAGTVVGTITAAADAAGISRVALLALAIAESNLDPNARRPTDPAQDQSFWPDVSMGLMQQTVRWSSEYAAWCVATGHLPATFPGADVIAQIGNLYYDPAHALAVAVPQLKRWLDQGLSPLDALCRYNKPAADPMTNPNRANYKRGLTAAYQMLGTPSVGTTLNIVHCPASPNHGGVRAVTKGCIIHSTRGGQAYGTEFTATLNWFANPAAQVSAHAVISRAGEVAFPVAADLIAWHDPASNSAYLGVELEQPSPDDPYTEAQYGALATLLRQWAQAFGFPLDRSRLRGHDETSSGIAEGKTDPGYQFNWTKLLGMLAAAPLSDVVAISNTIADELGIPRVVMLGCAVAESNLDPQARRPRDPAQDRAYWPDVSAGVWQQTVRWSQEYADAGYTGAYPGPAVVERILRLYIDPWHAGRVAAKQIAYWLTQEPDPLDALCRYNRPALEPGQNPNRANYARALVEARRQLGIS